MKRLVLLGLVWTAGSAGGQTATADDARDAAASPPETVVITARRRPELLERTPAAVSVIGSVEMAGRQAVQLADIGKLIPNVDINRFGVSNPSHAAVFVRGIGVQDHIITTDPAVGLYVDGVYVGRQMGANLRLAHVERVEVLRGPQGTLYGRNTLGGAINVVLRQPGDELARRVEVALGTRRRAEVSAYANERVDASVAWLASAHLTRRDGVGRALLVDAPKEVGEEAEATAHVAVRWRPSRQLSVIVSFDGARGVNGKSPSTIEIFDRDGFFPRELGLNESQLPANPDDSNSGQVSLFRQTHAVSGLSVRLQAQLAPHLSASAIASTRNSRYTGGFDDDHTFADLASFPERGQARQTTLEGQINGDDGRWDYVAGVYAGQERGHTNSGPWVYVGPGGYFDIGQTMRTVAVYGHAGWRLSDALRLSAGLRHSRESKEASAQFDSWSDPARVHRAGRWRSNTGELTVGHTASASFNSYLTWSTGFQSGGFPARPFGGPETFVAYNPTRARNLEAGVKLRGGAGRQASLAVFHTRYDDLPLPVAVPSGSAFVIVTENGGRAVSQGAELEGQLALPAGLALRGALGYLDARLRSVPANAGSARAGDRLALASRWTASVALHGRWPLAGGTFEGWFDHSFRDGHFGQLANSERNAIAARGLFNLRLSWSPQGGDWTLAFYGRNLSDKVYDVARLDSSFAGFTDVIRSNDRREFGLRLRIDR